MVGNHHQTLRELELNSSIGSQLDLTSDRLVTADSDSGRAPNLGHGSCCKTKRLFCHSHVSVVPVTVDEVQGRADKLGEENATAVLVACTYEGLCSYIKQHVLKYRANKEPRTICIRAPWPSFPEGCSSFGLGFCFSAKDFSARPASSSGEGITVSGGPSVLVSAMAASLLVCVVY